MPTKKQLERMTVADLDAEKTRVHGELRELRRQKIAIEEVMQAKLTAERAEAAAERALRDLTPEAREIVKRQLAKGD